MDAAQGRVLSLYDPARFEPLGDVAWSEARVRDSIAAICRDAEAAFDPVRLWPLHPADWEPGTAEVLRGVYLGAAGMLHALDRLAGICAPRLDLAAIAAELGEAAPHSPDEEDAGASLLAGSSGTLVVAHRLAPAASTLDALADAIASNVEHPSNEVLLGAPGTMVAARAIHRRTGDDRFAALWRDSARILLSRQEDDGLWTQELYGRLDRYIGAGHGFAGNVFALLDGREWLDDPAAAEGTAVRTARRLAVVDGDRGMANWPPREQDALGRVQWCHGAAGMVTSLAGAAPGDEEHTALMRAAGELVWHAGPLAGNASLCHGTAGNGFAFLALLERTGDELWLHRARTFAAHALAQVDRLRAESGRGRYALFTGDVGAAMLAAACLTGDDPRFPGLADL